MQPNPYGEKVRTTIKGVVLFSVSIRRALILAIGLASVLLALSSCMANGQPLIQPIRLLDAGEAVQPFSPLPNAAGEPLYYHHWRIVRALQAHERVSIDKVDAVEVTFDPFSAIFNGGLCGRTVYQIDFLADQRFALKSDAAANECFGDAAEQFQTLRNLFEATESYSTVGPELVLSGPDVVLRFAQVTPPFVDYGLEGGLDLIALNTMQEVVDQSPLIVIGTVGPVAGYWRICGYDDDGRRITPCGASSFGLPVTDLLLNVESVLRDDGLIVRGNRVTLSTMGYVTGWLRGIAGLSGSYLPPYTGDRYVFLLAPNPDGCTYSPYGGPYGQLILDGEDLRFSMGNFPPAQFSNDRAPLTLPKLIELARKPAAATGRSLPAQAGVCLKAAAPKNVVAAPAATPTAESPSIFPHSLYELVSVAPLIVIGKVEQVERYFDFTGYGDEQVWDAFGANPYVRSADLRLAVEEVLRDDGHITSAEPIILRKVGMSEEAFDFMEQHGAGFEGKRYIFLLTPNPDGTYSGRFNHFSQLEIDGDTLRLSNDSRAPLAEFENLEPVTVNAFIAYVKGE